MTPLEFITFIGDDYNAPAGEAVKALDKPLKIVSGDIEWEVLSYYRVDGQMILDIERKEVSSD